MIVIITIIIILVKDMISIIIVLLIVLQTVSYLSATFIVTSLEVGEENAERGVERKEMVMIMGREEMVMIMGRGKVRKVEIRNFI